MGHRANYIIIEKEKVNIYYNKWGAQGDGIIDLLLKDKNKVQREIRSYEENDALMNEIWMEGAILLDIDKRQLKYFGGDSNMSEGLNKAMNIRQQISSAWEGWNIQYADHGIEDIYKYLNLPIPEIAERYYSSIQFENADSLVYRDLKLLEQSANCLLTTLESGKLEHFQGIHMNTVFSLGPDKTKEVFLEKNFTYKPIQLSLSKLETFEKLYSSMIVDYNLSVLRYSTVEIFYKQLENYIIETIWNGWKIQRVNKTVDYNINYFTLIRPY